MTTEITLSGGYSDVSVVSGEVVVNRLTALVTIDIDSASVIVPAVLVSALFSSQPFYSFDLQQKFSASANRPLPEHNIKRFA